MITGVIGKPGSGKSLLLTHLAVGAILRGEPVYTNFLLKWRNILWLAFLRGKAEGIVPGRHGWAELGRRLGRWRCVTDYRGICEVAEGKLYFDEAHIWLWSRAWKELPRDVISWWSQSRKHGVDVWWAAQRSGAVDAHVRELTAEVIHCRRVFGSLRFVYQHEDMESSDKKRRIWGRQLLKLDPSEAACYNTREILQPPYELQASGEIAARRGGTVARRATSARR